jgi:hypothetical protein
MGLFKSAGVTSSNTVVPVGSPLEAAVAALTAAIGNAAVALGVIGVSTATVVESAVVGVIAAVFLLSNALQHKANVGP